MAHIPLKNIEIEVFSSLFPPRFPQSKIISDVDLESVSNSSRCSSANSNGPSIHVGVSAKAYELLEFSVDDQLPPVSGPLPNLVCSYDDELGNCVEQDNNSSNRHGRIMASSPEFEYHDSRSYVRAKRGEGVPLHHGLARDEELDVMDKSASRRNVRLEGIPPTHTERGIERFEDPATQRHDDSGSRSSTGCKNKTVGNEVGVKRGVDEIYHEGAHRAMDDITKYEWVLLTRHCEATGETKDAVYARRKTRTWTEGVQSKRVGKKIYVNPVEYNAWVKKSK